MTELAKVPVFILAGGLGTRFSEETSLRPKPMIEIGEIPILIHIMRWYYSFGFNDFVICAGYKSWEIKEYFLNYQFRQNNLVIDHRTNVFETPTCQSHRHLHERWRVQVVDTGLESMTGARLRIALEQVGASHDFENFAVTYGDGLSDVHLEKEFKFHVGHGRVGTMLGVPPIARFGEIAADENGIIKAFVEKPEARHGLINGGFFFFKKSFSDYLAGSDQNCILERGPLEKLAGDNKLVVFEHRSFWQCMDTLRDKNYLQDIWNSNRAPWKPQS